MANNRRVKEEQRIPMRELPAFLQKTSAALRVFRGLSEELEKARFTSEDS